MHLSHAFFGKRPSFFDMLSNFCLERMNNSKCSWCEKNHNTIAVFIEQIEEWENICRRCAITYYEDQIWTLKLELNILKDPRSPKKGRSPVESKELDD